MLDGDTWGPAWFSKMALRLGAGPEGDVILCCCADMAVFHYISWYNQRRCHFALDMRTPSATNTR